MPFGNAALRMSSSILGMCTCWMVHVAHGPIGEDHVALVEVLAISCIPACSCVEEVAVEELAAILRCFDLLSLYPRADCSEAPVLVRILLLLLLLLVPLSFAFAFALLSFILFLYSPVVPIFLPLLFSSFAFAFLVFVWGVDEHLEVDVPLLLCV